MVMLNISQKDLNSALSKELSIEDLRTVLFNIGLDLKNEDPEELAIEITPDRLDLISVQGLARAIKTFITATELPQYVVRESNYQVHITNHVNDVRPHTVCAVQNHYIR